MKEHRSYPRKKKVKFPALVHFFVSVFEPFVAPPPAHSDALSSRVGIHLSLSACHSNVDESTGVEDPLLGAALGLLWLFLGLDLGSLRLDFTGTSE